MQNAIGVFDSGLGGLTVLNAAIKLLPSEQFIYVADSLHAPFGNKSDDFILMRCLIICDFFKRQNVKCILLACNTATLACVAKLREKIDVPIVAIEPGLKPAVLDSKTQNILMLATHSTLQSTNYQNLVTNYAKNSVVHTKACNGWVELVESGRSFLTPVSPDTLQLIEQYLEILKDETIDQIVLGCTHYPFLKPLILQYIKSINRFKTLNVVDTSDAVAKQLQNILKIHNLLNEPDNQKKPKIVECYSSSDKTQSSLLQSLCNSPIQFLGQFE
ncbi:glutamate racemase [Marinicellulosiphila megalodicopiae]|uniref:glutamate racemase n=1 Tax=Marinicellulosiphila megalodicopiae TaxID=2724896 RepID=UPI003BB084C6